MCVKNYDSVLRPAAFPQFTPKKSELTLSPWKEVVVLELV
jgi:hypothetical protein